jgi:hypothetical protein
MKEGGIYGPGDCDCSLSYYVPLKDWVKTCASMGKPERVRAAALTYLSTVKPLRETIVKRQSVMICPHRRFYLRGEEGADRWTEKEMLGEKAWLNNVPLVYDMLTWFNVETAHRSALEKPEGVTTYLGNRLMFRDSGFECLEDDISVTKLIWQDRRTVESVVSDLRVEEWYEC